MPFAGNYESWLEVVDMTTDPFDYTDEFMSDHHRRWDNLLRPGIPVEDVQIGAADRGFFQLDQDFIGRRCRDRHLLHPDPFSRFALNQRFHRWSWHVRSAETG